MDQSCNITGLSNVVPSWSPVILAAGTWILSILSSIISLPIIPVVSLIYTGLFARHHQAAHPLPDPPNLCACTVPTTMGHKMVGDITTTMRSCLILPAPLSFGHGLGKYSRISFEKRTRDTIDAG